MQETAFKVFFLDSFGVDCVDVEASIIYGMRHQAYHYVTDARTVNEYFFKNVLSKYKRISVFFSLGSIHGRCEI